MGRHAGRTDEKIGTFILNIFSLKNTGLNSTLTK